MAGSESQADRGDADDLPRSKRLRGSSPGIRGARVRAAIEAFPRASFDNGPGDDVQTQLVATMLEGLELSGSELVLEVGTGSGYRAALLSRLARQVHTLEIRGEVAQKARLALLRCGVENATVFEADGSIGQGAGAPYQAILVAASANRVPTQLVDQLDLDGHLVIPIGDERGQLLVCYLRRGTSLEARTLAACRVGPLVMEKQCAPSVPWAPRAPT